MGFSELPSKQLISFWKILKVRPEISDSPKAPSAFIKVDCINRAVRHSKQKYDIEYLSSSPCHSWVSFTLTNQQKAFIYCCSGLYLFVGFTQHHSCLNAVLEKDFFSCFYYLLHYAWQNRSLNMQSNTKHQSPCIVEQSHVYTGNLHFLAKQFRARALLPFRLSIRVRVVNIE